MLEILQELAMIHGVSGDEGRVREAILQKIGSCCETRTDALGNLIAFKKGKRTPKNRILLDAHMDEIGFIITHIEDDGFLRFATVGGVEIAVIPGKQVAVGTQNLPGVIGLKPIHLLEEDEKDAYSKLENLMIDIGASSKEEALKYVRPGDRATFVSEFVRFGEGCIKGKALDDRAGCALMMDLLLGEPPVDVWCSFSVQEENGCIGAITASRAVNPDISIVLEATTAGDVLDNPSYKQVCRLGKGPAISFMDRGTIYDPELFRLGMETAEKSGILHQAKEGIFGGNDARSIQTSGVGCRMLAVSLPCRYLHSPSCVIHESDYIQAGKLIPELLTRFADL